MLSTQEYRRHTRDPEDEHSWLTVPMPGGNLVYHYRRGEYRPAMRFIRWGIGGFLHNRNRPIIVPPPEDDEMMSVRNHFTGLCEEVFLRGYVAMIGKRRIFTSPATLVSDTDQHVPDYLDQLGSLFGRALRIVPPDAVSKYWGGRLEEFDEIAWQGERRYRRLRLIWSLNNDHVYRAGIPVFRFLELLESHPPDPLMSYEDYFRSLRTRAKTGEITPSPWPTEALHPDQPHLL